MTNQHSLGVAKDLRFSDIHLGMSASFFVMIDADMVRCFAMISGDFNPLHTDAEYARSVGHPGPVVFGMLTASFYSRLVGMFLPGKYALLQQIEVGYTLPVYVGDQLMVEGEVVDLHESVRQVEIRARILNQSLERVSRAKINIGMYA